MRKLYLFGILVTSLFVLAACTPEEEEQVVDDDPIVDEEPNEEPVEEPMSIIDVATEAGSFTTLLAALDEADLTTTLDSEGSYTVFAPTDEAFNDLLDALDIEAADLLADPDLANILLYHVLAGEYLAADVVANAPFTMETLQGFGVDFSVMDGMAYINDAQIVTTDVMADNGVIHIIDQVILPQDTIIGVAEAAGNFSILLTALETAGLTEALDSSINHTVFAPTDEAFADLLAALEIEASDLLADPNLEDILLYHVLRGEFTAADVVANAPFTMETLQGFGVDFSVMDGMAYINGVQIVTTDIQARNGVIHVIEEVILPEDTIVGVAKAAGSFSILLTALDTAGLTDTLNSPGEFTVFAPTDEAFADLLAALEIEAADLLADPDLANILLYHVLSGEYLAADVVANAPFTMETLQGFGVDFSVMDGMAYINGAQIVTTDIQARNGVIHVIDEVILPEDTIVGVAEAAGSFTTLLAALDTAGLTDTLNSPGEFTVFAPTDAAFTDLLAALEIEAADLLADPDLANILLYHVLSGEYLAADVVANAPFTMETLQGFGVDFSVMDGMAYINGAQIVTTDIQARNGVIHVIDEVILPEDTIIGVAEANGSFTTLLAALDAANLTDTLDSVGSYTVFAPTDAAFADLLAALEIEAADLLADPDLANILLYHVLSGEYLAADVVAGAPFSMETLEGTSVDFTVVDGLAYINDVQIVTTDLVTRNGVIHVIEAVLLP
jgi:transforming growth factor-beta-induced protein